MISIAIVVVALLLPTIFRSTANPQKLAAFSNDEPALTMALDAMTARPLGNPANYYVTPTRQSPAVPRYWGTLRYTEFVYYGGLYLGLAFLIFGPLSALGVPAFPLAPILLRAIAAAAAGLSLTLLYGISRRHASRAAGVLATAWLATDSYFRYYATTIHPDSLQLLLGLIAVVVAVEHAEQGAMGSLAMLGGVAGLVQGTKAGGPWMIPPSLLALIFGLSRPSFTLKWSASVLLRLVVLGLAAVVAFFVSTPYAFIDGYYFESMRAAYQLISSSAVGAIGPVDWFVSLGSHFGVIGTALLLAGGISLLIRACRRDRVGALVLAFAASQIVWFIATGKLWVQIGYLLLALGLLALFGFEVLLRLCGRFRLSRKVAAGGILAVIVLAQGPTLILAPLDALLADRSTIIAASDWARSAGIPRASRIVFDDLAYFDPALFPRATMRGGVLTWNQVRNDRPDYIVLSSSLSDAGWFQEKLKTGHWEPADPDPFNLRLYQDLLPVDVPGAPVEGGTFVTALKPQSGRCESPNEAPFSGTGWSAVLRRVENLGGIMCDRSGPTIRFYRMQWN